MTTYYEQAAELRARLAEREASADADPDELLELRHAFLAALEEHARRQRQAIEASVGLTRFEITQRRQGREVKQREMDRLGVDTWWKANAVIVREQKRQDAEVDIVLNREQST
jgi:hypothetical protein